jgi:transcriptional regulator with AAA-type ATPase domain
MKKNTASPSRIFITWHLTTHGQAYVQHLLAKYHQFGPSLFDSKNNGLEINQEEMSEYWLDEELQPEEGTRFNKVYVLCPQQSAYDALSMRRRKASIDRSMKDEQYDKEQTNEFWNDIYNEDHSIEEDYELIMAHEKKDILFRQWWRNMQYYTWRDQQIWWTRYSPAKRFYPEERVEFVPFEELHDLRDYDQIAQNLAPWLRKLLKKHPKAQWIINTNLTCNEITVVWFVFAELNLLASNTSFISFNDNKAAAPDRRFKPMILRMHPFRLSDNLFKKINIYPNTRSKTRKLANEKFKHYLEQGFSLLILGERGTGKTRMIDENAGQLKKKLITANCASFDDDSKAESELFGYAKGAFTGAQRSYKGLFKEADKGILFLDEIHHLSKRVQAKLLTALSTDTDNNFKIRRLGSTEVETVSCQVIFASNRSIEELRENLHPDFFDRITQLLISLPPIRETREELESDWESVWQQLRFKEKGLDCPTDPKLFKWLREQPLYGNFRDLQKIAIYYKTFLTMEESLRKLLDYKDALSFTQAEFNLLQSPSPYGKHPYFNTDEHPKTIEKRFLRDLSKWLEDQYGSTAKAIEKLKLAFPEQKLSEKTLYNWKTGI